MHLMRQEEGCGISQSKYNRYISVVDVTVVAEFFEDGERLQEGHPLLGCSVAGNQGLEYIGNGHLRACQRISSRLRPRG